MSVARDGIFRRDEPEAEAPSRRRLRRRRRPGPHPRAYPRPTRPPPPLTISLLSRAACSPPPRRPPPPRLLPRPRSTNAMPSRSVLPSPISSQSIPSSTRRRFLQSQLTREREIPVTPVTPPCLHLVRVRPPTLLPERAVEPARRRLPIPASTRGSVAGSRASGARVRAAGARRVALAHRRGEESREGETKTERRPRRPRRSRRRRTRAGGTRTSVASVPHRRGWREVRDDEFDLVARTSSNIRVDRRNTRG